MPTILKNGINRHVVFTAIANDSIQLSDVVVANSGESVDGLNITKIIWSGQWTVKRGANTVWQSDALTFGTHDFSGNGFTLNQFNTANVVLTTSGNSFIAVECNKATYANGSIVT